MRRALRWAAEVILPRPRERTTARRLAHAKTSPSESTLMVKVSREILDDRHSRQAHSAEVKSPKAQTCELEGVVTAHPLAQKSRMIRLTIPKKC